MQGTDSSGAALVCEHVAGRKAPILYAFRDEPVEPEDSGWQFLCGTDDDIEQMQVWSVNEVLRLEPTLGEWVDRAAPVEIFRSDEQSPWKERID